MKGSMRRKFIGEVLEKLGHTGVLARFLKRLSGFCANIYTHTLVTLISLTRRMLRVVSWPKPM